MAEQGKAGLRPPGGLLRLAYRAPICLYRAGLGWILGKRFLMLTHTGRRSGLPRRVVIEVMRRDEMSGTFYVAAAYGDKADWLRNIRKTPLVSVTSGREQVHARAEVLSREQGADELQAYGERYPAALRVLTRLFGQEMPRHRAGYLALAGQMPIVALRPVQAPSPEGER
jgi:deazaflavin-dependent oxidoreductase (nitroreductase family)